LLNDDNWLAHSSDARVDVRGSFLDYPLIEVARPLVWALPRVLLDGWR